MRNLDGLALANMVDSVLAKPELKTFAGLGGLKVIFK